MKSRSPAFRSIDFIPVPRCCQAGIHRHQVERSSIVVGRSQTSGLTEDGTQLALQRPVMDARQTLQGRERGRLDCPDVYRSHNGCLLVLLLFCNQRFGSRKGFPKRPWCIKIAPYALLVTSNNSRGPAHGRPLHCIGMRRSLGAVGYLELVCESGPGRRLGIICTPASVCIRAWRSHQAIKMACRISAEPFSREKRHLVEARYPL